MRPFDQVMAQRTVMLDQCERWGLSEELLASMRALAVEIADHIEAGSTLTFNGVAGPVSKWCVHWPEELFTMKSTYKPFLWPNNSNFNLFIPPGSL